MTKADMQWHEDDYVAGNPGLAGSAAMVVLSGCSGSGKSTLLAELGRRGMPVQPEAGRQIVKEQLLIGGHALPWDDAARFVELAASRAAWQFNSVRPGDKPVVFDRSVVDVVAFLDYKGLETPAHLRRMLEVYRYHRTVLMTPPWGELFRANRERRKDFREAVSEFHALCRTFGDLGYEIVEIPWGAVSERADAVETILDRIR